MWVEHSGSEEVQRQDSPRLRSQELRPTKAVVPAGARQIPAFLRICYHVDDATGMPTRRACLECGSMPYDTFSQLVAVPPSDLASWTFRPAAHIRQSKDR